MARYLRSLETDERRKTIRQGAVRIHKMLDLDSDDPDMSGELYDEDGLPA